ncbi:CoA-binding protein, partial [Dehalococcoidia bacterium]|nr:CoA-binding protein [Dehalococcoidia bacterium]
MRYFDHKTLDRMFYPKSVAVVGAKAASNYGWLRRNLVFEGKLYSVQIDKNEVPGIEEMGVPNYESVRDIPEAVDYVIFAVPRGITPAVFEDCIEAGVGGVSLYSSGFAETDDLGIELQAKLSKLSIDSGVPLIGPNSMGVYNPGIGLRQGNEQPYGEKGVVGFLGQSGTHSSYYSMTVDQVYGIKIGLGVSFGNAAVLDAADWVEYIGGKSDVEVLTAYIEGIGDSRKRFVDALSKVAALKPALIWKGGCTEDGSRASYNHTSSSPMS